MSHRGAVMYALCLCCSAARRGSERERESNTLHYSGRDGGKQPTLLVVAADGTPKLCSLPPSFFALTVTLVNLLPSSCIVRSAPPIHGCAVSHPGHRSSPTLGLKRLRQTGACWSSARGAPARFRRHCHAPLVALCLFSCFYCCDSPRFATPSFDDEHSACGDAQRSEQRHES